MRGLILVKGSLSVTCKPYKVFLRREILIIAPCTTAQIHKVVRGSPTRPSYRQ